MLDVGRLVTSLFEVHVPRKLPEYPFVPKSAAWLRAGEFWALPLSDGTFGCGRVIEVPSKVARRDSMQFLAGVLDWHSTIEPSAESISRAPCLSQGDAHIRAITRSGGKVLGFRDLASDSIEPWEFRGAEFWKNSNVHRGLACIRAQTPADVQLPVLATWGFNVPRLIAESRFVKQSDLWAPGA